MKTLFRVLVVLFLLVCLLVVGGYLFLTNAGVQTRLVAKNLPAGSTVERVRLTFGAVEVAGLNLVAGDGSRVEVASLSGRFSPLAALTDQTIRVEVLEVSGVDIQLPSVAEDAGVAVVAEGVDSSVDSEVGEVGVSESSEADVGAPEAAALSLEPLFALGEFDWLLDVERVAVSGRLTDGQGGRFRFELDSTAVRPGLESTLTLKLNSEFAEAQANGLQVFDAVASFGFTQKVTGGLEALWLDLSAAGEDAAGATLLGFSKQVQVGLDVTTGVARVEGGFKLDMPDPARFVAELSGLGAVDLEGSVRAELSDGAVVLADANVRGLCDAREVIWVDLKQPLRLGGGVHVPGELLDLKVSELPVEWVQPWLPEGLGLVFQPLSLDLRLRGNSTGGFDVSCLQPLALNGLSVEQDGRVLVEDLSVALHPGVSVGLDQSVEFAVNELQVSDRYGPIIVGELTGSRTSDVDGQLNPLAGVVADLVLSIKLQPLLNQPGLRGATSIMAGDVAFKASVDGAAEFPLRVNGLIKGLRARSLPGAVQDYAVRVQGKLPAGERIEAQVAVEAGRVSAPSSDLQVLASAQVAEVPLQFDLGLTGERLRVQDFDVLTAAFQPADAGDSAAQGVTVADSSAGEPRAGEDAEDVVVDQRPPWADLAGRVTVDVERLEVSPDLALDAVKADLLVSEAVLDVRELSAAIGDGEIGGTASVHYDASEVMDAYRLAADLSARQLNLQDLVGQQSVPVSGLFDASIGVRGRGVDLNAAVEQADVSVEVHGVDGVLTSFKLDQRMLSGMSLVGSLLGRTKHGGIAAVAEVIPYFKNIGYSDLYFDLTRSADGQIRLERLSLLGDFLLFDGGGVIQASSWMDVMDSPMDLRLQLGAKGALEGHLEQLNLLVEEASADGYRRWTREIQVPGTLNDPDKGSLVELLLEAGRNALNQAPVRSDAPASPASAETTATQDAAEVSTPAPAAAEPVPEAPVAPEESNLPEGAPTDALDMGLDMINSLLGG